MKAVVRFELSLAVMISLVCNIQPRQDQTHIVTQWRNALVKDLSLQYPYLSLYLCVLAHRYCGGMAEQRVLLILTRDPLQSREIPFDLHRGCHGCRQRKHWKNLRRYVPKELSPSSKSRPDIGSISLFLANHTEFPLTINMFPAVTCQFMCSSTDWLVRRLISFFF